MSWNPAPISVRPQIESLEQEVPCQLLNYLQDFQFLSYHFHQPKTNKVLLIENFFFPNLSKKKLRIFPQILQAHIHVACMRAHTQKVTH